jgi:hypothetical protein
MVIGGNETSSGIRTHNESSARRDTLTFSKNNQSDDRWFDSLQIHAMADPDKSKKQKEDQKFHSP